MEILVYTQQGSMGGSTRLLLNLARYLGREHRVSVALGRSHTPKASRELLGHFGDLRVLPADPGALGRQRFDVAVLHLPFSPRDAEWIRASRKVAVIMELATRQAVTIREEHCAQFERVIHLHAEQVAHLSAATRDAKCSLLPIIDNIDFEPEFAAPPCVGAIGWASKTQLPLALALLEALPPPYSLCCWSQDGLAVDALAALGAGEAERALQLIELGRLRRQPPITDIRMLSREYRALLHTPRHGNGTSVVVSDALRCGKLAILSPLPAYREAYSQLEGVLFMDRPAAELGERICAYSREDFTRIRDAYRARFDRGAIMRHWSDAILDGAITASRAHDGAASAVPDHATVSPAPAPAHAAQLAVTAARATPGAASRNAPCPCGSGKRYKHCCGLKEAAATPGPKPAAAETASAVPAPSAAAELNQCVARAIESYGHAEFALAAELCDRVLGGEAANPMQRLAAAEVGGSACTRLDMHGRARELFLVAHEIEPSRVQTLQNLALNAIQLGDFARAIDYAQRLLAVEPGNVAACNAIANALQERGHWHAARDLYARFIVRGEHDPTGA